MPLSAPWNGFLQKIADAATQQELAALEHELFGRKAGALTVALKELSALPEDERKNKGQELNGIKRELETAIHARGRSLRGEKMSSLASSDTLDPTLDVPEKERGSLHLIHEYIRKAEEVFGRMGFDTATGPEIETEHYNFNMLNIPESHPARDSQDTFWIAGQKNTVLRTHTSPVQIHYMEKHKPPFRMICTGKVYRKDYDATHSPMFHQIEGLMIGEDVTLANMKAVMESAIRELIAEDTEFRWRTGYFPFVEPGLEMDVRWRGDDAESREGKWLEIVGCGMVHPNVLTNCNIDPKKYQGFAFGFGVERMLMIRHQIPDLRLFYENDRRFLRQF